MVTTCALCLPSIHFIRGASNLACVKYCLLQLLSPLSRCHFSLLVLSAAMLEGINSSGHPFLATTNFQRFHLLFHLCSQSPTKQPRRTNYPPLSVPQDPF